MRAYEYPRVARIAGHVASALVGKLPLNSGKRDYLGVAEVAIDIAEDIVAQCRDREARHESIREQEEAKRNKRAAEEHERRLRAAHAKFEQERGW